MSTPTTQARAPLFAALSTAFHQAWQQRSAREQQLMRIAAWVLLATALWIGALAPALQTWHEAPARQALLDATSQQMQQLQAQAQTLKKPSAVSRAEAIRWLEENIPAQLGEQTRWQLEGERLSVQLSNTSPERLASWLGQARERAQALPVQAQLQRSPAETAKPKAPNSASNATDKPELASPQVLWQGRLLLSLP
jgi:general secretion pathway protein M